MGSKGQFQYNGTSTFQDAFARHRWSLGERCVSIDVSLVTGVSYVAEHDDVASNGKERGSRSSGRTSFTASSTGRAIFPAPLQRPGSPRS